MPLYTVALMAGPQYVWILSSPENDRIYEQHPSVLRFVHIQAADGPLAVTLAVEKLNKITTLKNIYKLAKTRNCPKNLDENVILQFLWRNNWQRTKTAKELGINVRTLRRYMLKYDIELRPYKKRIVA